MCSVDGSETYYPYSRTYRTARRPHLCEECGRSIQAGERYSYAAGLYDHQWNTHKSCAHCAVGQEWLGQECGGFIHGGVWEDIEAHNDEYPALRIPLRRVALSARRRWRWFNGQTMRVPTLPPGIKSVVSA